MMSKVDGSVFSVLAQALVLSCLTVSAAGAQDYEEVHKAQVVRITRLDPETKTVAAQGTGFVIAKSGSELAIVTAAHVLEGAKNVEVELALPGEFPRKLSAEVFRKEVDQAVDIALLRAAAPPDIFSRLNPLPVRLSAGVAEQASVAVLGYPNTVSGLAASFGRIAGREGARLLVQASASGGNSGGPVMHQRAVTAMVSRSDEQFVYCISSETIKSYLENWGVTVVLVTEPPPVVPVAVACLAEDDQSSLVRACVRAVRVEAKRVVVQVLLDNKTADTLLLAADQRNARCGATLNDDRASEYRVRGCNVFGASRNQREELLVRNISARGTAVAPKSSVVRTYEFTTPVAVDSSSGAWSLDLSLYVLREGAASQGKLEAASLSFRGIKQRPDRQ
jgi:hypothetical protein